VPRNDAFSEIRKKTHNDTFSKVGTKPQKSVIASGAKQP